MLLEVHERMQLLNLIPGEGGYEALKTYRVHREMLQFTSEEVETLNLTNTVQPSGGVKTSWDPAKANLVVKDIPIDKFMTEFFRKKLAEIERDDKLSEHTLSLYEKFVIMAFK